MPDMDGLELAREIRADVRLNTTQLIMLTSAAADDSGKEMRRAGIAAQINKPTRPAQLRKRIAEVLGATPDDATQIGPVGLWMKEPVAKIAGARILLVEDNPVNREVATQMLLAMRCEVQEVTNGKEAVEIVRQEEFDLVLMDCEMPIMDGYAATKAIRSRERESDTNRHLPIVALTAHALPEDRRRCLTSGMDGYLSKPFSMEDLRSRLKEWLGTSDDLNDGSITIIEDAKFSGHPDNYETITKSVLDTINSLSADDDDALLNRVIGLYQSSSADLIEALEEALDARDGKAMRSAAHSLKSSSGNVGAERLVNMCRDMETAARENSLEEMPDRFDKLRCEHKKVLKELNDWIQN
jgi:two-component system sensor histidine kinase/response regulator